MFEFGKDEKKTVKKLDINPNAKKATPI